ncbi:hypothetical protein [Gulosibacter molinativorax]|uniref:ABC transporter permease n=1 Tax=Gulosibacter molinativorax TaxID=256821 RepID=A0ABT7C7Z7_9MICO|nr:hypothetical protein [Gulosibacter molinativorax]MDJ1370786.1 hypothetical protein [Gulosibacter molinativorax]QUY62122.1 Hypothetical protein GMOLON4_1417 [Gulosibacter molinativorax]
MNVRVSQSVAVWRDRSVRSIGDQAYLVYVIIMVALVTIVPAVRAVWVGTTSEQSLAVLSSAVAPSMTSIIVAVLWGAMLLLGRERGPALRHVFPTYALANSDIPPYESFRSPFFRAGLVVVAATTGVAALIGSSLVSNGMTDLFDAVIFALAGMLVGLIAAVSWLAGQVFPRVAVPAAVAVIALSVATFAFPGALSFMPWGWAGLAYPGHGTFEFMVPLALLAAGAISIIPSLMNRLGVAQLVAQAARWESVSSLAAGMEFGAAAAVYRSKPGAGRNQRAVRLSGGGMWRFLVRDAIGARRTPSRFVVGILGIAAAGILVTLATTFNSAGWVVGAIAGVVLFAGLGPLTDGVRHAATVAADLPLYGISDERLLVNHAIFPLTVTVIVLIAAALLCSVVLGVGGAAPAISSVALGVLTVIARVSAALKGPLPPSLLTPVPTIMGDVSVIARLAWAIDGVLFAALIGASASLLTLSTLLPVAVTIALICTTVHRWRRRA